MVEGQLNRAEVILIAGAVGGAAAEGSDRCCPNSATWKSRESRCTRFGAGFRATRARRCSDISVARQPRQCPGGLRGDGASVDQAFVGQAAAVAPGGSGACDLANRFGGGAQRDFCVVSCFAIRTPTSIWCRCWVVPWASSHLLATLAEANCLVMVPVMSNRSAPVRLSTSLSWLSAARCSREPLAK